MDAAGRLFQVTDRLYAWVAPGEPIVWLERIPERGHPRGVQGGTVIWPVMREGGKRWAGRMYEPRTLLER